MHRARSLVGAAILVVMGVMTTLFAPTAAATQDFGEWSSATRVEDSPGTDSAFNGPSLDGCPFISPDSKSFFMASNRPGGLGGIDIWVSTRQRASEPWGAPVNLGPTINSAGERLLPDHRPRREDLLLRVEPPRLLWW